MKAKSFLPKTIIISAILAQLTFAALPSYEIIDLGTLGGDDSSADFISNNGGIVGVSENSLFQDRAVFFDPTVKSNIIDLGTLGGDESLASSINTNRQIVGVASDSKGRIRATLFDATGSGSNTDLGTIGGRLSGALSVNEIGLIVGYANNAIDDWRAVIFDPTGNGDNIDLGTLGGDSSDAYSINNNMQIVGKAETKLSGYYKATLFDPTGKGNNMDLDPFHSVPSCATSINDNGQIVGFARYEPFDDHPILFDSTGSGNNIDLGTLGGTWGQAWSINNRGQIVGKAEDNLGRCRAALFDPSGAGNNIDLNTLINANLGWILKSARSINDAGLIVGQGISPDDERHAYLLKPVPPKIIYVDDNASGANDGSSWADAYNYLQDALTVAWSGDEIQIARGIYKPDQGAGITPGDREATFQLINGVTIKGGYAGAGKPDPNSRDIELYETILSGDLAGDDGPSLIQDFAPCMRSHIVPPKVGCDCFDLDRDNDVDEYDLRIFLADNNYNENSYNVVTGSGTDASAVLDGFTISAGNANGPGHYRGGGMYNDSSSPTLTNCAFNGNSAHYGGGGGMYNWEGSSPTLVNCTFSANSAYTRGGGIFNSSNCRPIFDKCTFSGNSARWGGGMGNSDASPTLINCDFTDNSAGNDGGGMYNFHCTPAIDNCTFNDNSARWGGGMSNEQYGEPILTNCTFSGNLASDEGGGMYNSEASPTFANCIFKGNSASVYGGGMQNWSNCRSTLTNCMFNGNSAYYGGGIYNSYNCRPMFVNCTFSGNSARWGGGIGNSSSSMPFLTNCIFWANVPMEIYRGTPTITYSDVQGGWSGEGNINVDPCFMQLGYWDANDVWIDGDYHLLSDSPCIDAGDPDYIAGPNETDLDGRPRVIGGRIDMGAYETPVFAEARILPRTINLASKGKWITCYIWLSDDYDVTDIDPGSVMLERQIKAEQFTVDEQKQVATATFDREDVQSILDVGDIKLTITCQLIDGTYFEATDIVQVTDKGGWKSDK